MSDRARSEAAELPSASRSAVSPVPASRPEWLPLAIVAALAGVAIIVAMAVTPQFLTVDNIRAILRNASIVGIVAVSYGSLEDWQPIWRRETAFVAAAAVLVSSGRFFIIGAFRNTDVGIVSGYRYSVIIFAVIAGYLIWGDIPEPLAFVGIGLIVASGLYTMHRQRVRPDSNLKLTADPTP